MKNGKEKVKKKVLIIGEIKDPDNLNETSNAEIDFYENQEDDFDYHEYGYHNRIRRGPNKYSGRQSQQISQSHSYSSNLPPGYSIKRKSTGSVFVPVAAYSVTRTKPSNNGYRKRQGSGPGKFIHLYINRNIVVNEL